MPRSSGTRIIIIIILIIINVRLPRPVEFALRVQPAVCGGIAYFDISYVDHFSRYNNVCMRFRVAIVFIIFNNFRYGVRSRERGFQFVRRVNY